MKKKVSLKIKLAAKDIIDLSIDPEEILSICNGKLMLRDCDDCLPLCFSLEEEKSFQNCYEKIDSFIIDNNLWNQYLTSPSKWIRSYTQSLYTRLYKDQ